MATTRDNAIMLALYRTASRDKDFKWVVKYSKSETAFLRMGDQGCMLLKMLGATA